MADLNDPLRLDQFDEALLEAQPDAILDALTREAAQRAEAPIGLISLITRRLQFFRTSVGLPADLDLSRATSRCESFCQFVVKSESAFLVTDASSDTRIPKALVERYSVQAYAGVPLRLGEQVIGSLCVVDGKARVFDASLVADLEAIAAKVVERLTALETPEEEPSPEELRGLPLPAVIERALRDASIVERALVELDAILHHVEAIDLSKIAADLVGRHAGTARDITALHSEMLAHMKALRVDVRRLAGAAQAQGVPVAPDVLDGLRRSGRAAARSLYEVGPLVRLMQGIGAETVSAEDFARNAAVLREALEFDRDTLATLRDMREAIGRVAEALQQARAGSPGSPSSPGAAPDSGAGRGRPS